MARCVKTAPGPYGLKTLVGFDDHDPTKRREPAYSMRFRAKMLKTLVVPGPYKIKDGYTNHGPYKSPAQTMVFKPKARKTFAFPGPGAYAPENYKIQCNAPAYSMVFRHKKTSQNVGPGPAYMLPTCMGPQIVDIKATGACTMAFRHERKTISLGPGPAAYSTPLKVFKKRDPAFSMKFRHRLLDRKAGPGPQYYVPLELYKKREPTPIHGIKYSPCANVGFMENDDFDC